MCYKINYLPSIYKHTHNAVYLGNASERLWQMIHKCADTEHGSSFKYRQIMQL